MTLPVRPETTCLILTRLQRKVSMKSVNRLQDQTNWSFVRPRFLLGCAVCLLVLILPGLAGKRLFVQRAYLTFASLAILSAWLFLLKSDETRSKWRSSVALATSLYLTASIPIFLYELSDVRWRIRHPLPQPLISTYVWPWVHWGYLLLLLGFAGSFFAQGRVRIALLTASVLLLALRVAMVVWIL
jgi:hypothetical protein